MPECTGETTTAKRKTDHSSTLNTENLAASFTSLKIYVLGKLCTERGAGYAIESDQATPTQISLVQGEERRLKSKLRLRFFNWTRLLIIKVTRKLRHLPKIL